MHIQYFESSGGNNTYVGNAVNIAATTAQGKGVEFTT